MKSLQAIRIKSSGVSVSWFWFLDCSMKLFEWCDCISSKVIYILPSLRTNFFQRKRECYTSGQRSQSCYVTLFSPISLISMKATMFHLCYFISFVFYFPCMCLLTFI
ncbi:hypothetical protein HanRHA438_Chr09g0420111 [Helianthus annuus]|nr:hypothetical protein HanRHA438_Chr09g0420111 [Helianthus annuus]